MQSTILCSNTALPDLQFGTVIIGFVIRQTFTSQREIRD